MQNFGLEDLSHVQSRRNLLKYLVRVEMASDWLRGFIDRFWQNKFPPKSRYGVQTRWQALLEPGKMKKEKKKKKITIEGKSTSTRIYPFPFETLLTSIKELHTVITHNTNPHNRVRFYACVDNLCRVYG